ncbi:hypothetical protein CTEN210_00036 [Chaetoceros tenuissimus]|uniref:RING-type domain-containing protein n=1 Tax=Chaetoceros tenuissimus TaxID=426638 RepID=A0AAD3GYK9_9STRA|nr:hypothetical protein CTEN210_00036 [Chaetoceros tenuissimus]
MNYEISMTSMNDRTATADSNASRIKPTQGNEKDGTAVTLEENEDTSRELESKEIKELVRTIRIACFDKEWKQIEKILSDESISKEEKRIVFQDDDSDNCRHALVHGAPFHIVKSIIDLMDPDSPKFLSFGDSAPSWLHLALLWTKDPADDYYGKVPFDVIELLVSSGGRKLVNMQSKRKIHRKRTSLQLYLEQEEGNCPKIITLLLKVGGLELSEIEDEDGYSTRDFSNEPQRKIIIDYLKTLQECPRVQKQIEAFQAVDVTPTEFYYWVKNEEFDRVRSYLNDEKVSTDAKMKCINVQTALDCRPFHLICNYHGPIDIAEKMVDIVGKDLLFLKDEDGKNSFHVACDHMLYAYEDDDYIPEDVDCEVHCEFVAFLLKRGGWKLLLETNNEGETALYNMMTCKLTNLECVKLVVKAGGDELLAFQDMPFFDDVGGNTILHYASDREDPDREVIKYLVSVGGTRLVEIKDNDGRRAEDYWSNELKEYIVFTTKTSPELSDDLQCPICYDTLFHVHLISQCCHRFCKKCITQSYNKIGNACPVCRAKFSMRNVKKDPLLGKLALAIREEKCARDELQAQLSESQKENNMLREQLQNALKRKHHEL